jgi:protein SCO1/2
MFRRFSIFALLTSVHYQLVCGADQPKPAELQDVQVTEKLGQSVDLNLEFIDETGYPKKLGTYFQSGRPVILNLVYYTCPMLCNLVLNHQTDTLRAFEWTPGREFEIVTISIDPTENFGMAQKKKAMYLEKYDRKDAGRGWHFLVDHQANVKELAKQVGFGYKFDAQRQQYAHTAAVMVLTPEGKVSRYLYGLMRPDKVRDVKLALIEAAQERFGLSERVLLWCFHYDPLSRSYAPFARNFMKLGGGLAALIMCALLYRLWAREKSRGYQSEFAAAGLPKGPAGQMGIG